MSNYMLCFLFLAQVNKAVHSHGKPSVVNVQCQWQRQTGLCYLGALTFAMLLLFSDWWSSVICLVSLTRLPVYFRG